MSSVFTVLLDLSLVKNDEKKNQLYVAMADTTKMKIIYEFKHWIKFLFSLECSVELFHGDAVLHDLDDIRVLSLLDVVQVRPIEDDKKCDQKKFILKLKEYYKKYGDLNLKLMPKDIDSNNCFIETDKTVHNIEPPQDDESVKTEEVPNLGTDQKVDILCNELLQENDKTYNEIGTSEDKMFSNVSDCEENKTLKLKNENGMVENLKLGTHLQQKYLGWCTKAEKKYLQYYYEKSKRGKKLKDGGLDYLCNSDAKFTNDFDFGLENKQHTFSDLIQEDKKIRQKIGKETCSSPVKFQNTKINDLCYIQPPVQEMKSNSSTEIQSSYSGDGGNSSDHIPTVLQKPLTSVSTDTDSKKSVGGINPGNNPLPFYEILKMLRKAAVSRSKILPPSNPPPRNNEQNKKITKTFKKSKVQTAPASASLNDQQNIIKHQSGNSEAAHSVFQYNQRKKKKKSKMNKKAEIQDKTLVNTAVKNCNKQDASCTQKTEKNVIDQKTSASNSLLQPNQMNKRRKSNSVNEPETMIQGNILLKGCEKIDKIQKTEKKIIDEKASVSKFLLQPNQMMRRRKSNSVNETEPEKMFQGNVLFKGCEKIDKSCIQKTQIGKVEPKTTAPKSLVQQNQFSVNKKIDIGNKSQGTTLVKDCEKLDNIQFRKIDGTAKPEIDPKPSGAAFQQNQTKRRKSKKNKTKPGNKVQGVAMVKGCENFGNGHIQKIENAAKVEVETASSSKSPLIDIDHFCKIETTERMELKTDTLNPVNQYDNERGEENAPGDDFTKCSTSNATLIKEHDLAPLLTEKKQEKIVSDNIENDGIKNSHSDKLFTLDDISGPRLKVQCPSVDYSCIGESTGITNVDYCFFDETTSFSNLNFLQSNEHENSNVTDDVQDKTKDAGEVDNFIFSHMAKTENAMVSLPLLSEEKQEKAGMNDLGDFEDKNNDAIPSGQLFYFTNQVISLQYKVPDNKIDEGTIDENVLDNTKEGKPLSLDDIVYFESDNPLFGKDENEANSAHFVDEFKSEDMESLLVVFDYEDESANRTAGSGESSETNLNTFGSCTVVKHDVIALSYRSIESTKTDVPEDCLCENESLIDGSVAEMEFEKLTHPSAKSSATNQVSGLKNGFSSEVINRRYVIDLVKNALVRHNIFSTLLKAFLIALIIMILYLDFLKLR